MINYKPVSPVMVSLPKIWEYYIQ